MAPASAAATSGGSGDTCVGGGQYGLKQGEAHARCPTEAGTPVIREQGSKRLCSGGRLFNILGDGKCFSTVPVPGPVLGAGLPAFVASCGALIGLARRRRRGQAQVA